MATPRPAHSALSVEENVAVWVEGLLLRAFQVGRSVKFGMAGFSELGGGKGSPKNRASWGGSIRILKMFYA